jgi:hypothetical protein
MKLFLFSRGILNDMHNSYDLMKKDQVWYAVGYMLLPCFFFVDILLTPVYILSWPIKKLIPTTWLLSSPFKPKESK